MLTNLLLPTTPEKIQSTNSPAIPFNQHKSVPAFSVSSRDSTSKDSPPLPPRSSSEEGVIIHPPPPLDRRLKDGSLFGAPVLFNKFARSAAHVPLSLDEVNRYLTQFSSRAFKRANTENNGDFHVISPMIPLLRPNAPTIFRIMSA